MLDIHAHILPGVDDGAVDDAMSIEMLKAARHSGIDRIVTTPHVSRDYDIKRSLRKFEHSQKVAQAHGIMLIRGYEISVGALVGVVITPEFLAQLTIGGTNFILVEFPNDVPPVDWEYLLSDIKRVGFHAIIAHPERYRYIAKDIFMARELLNYGCELQLGALSFLSGRLSSERCTAMKLLDKGYVSYIASDAHHPNDYNSYSIVRRRLGQSWSTDGLLERLL